MSDALPFSPRPPGGEGMAVRGLRQCGLDLLTLALSTKVEREQLFRMTIVHPGRDHFK